MSNEVVIRLGFFFSIFLLVAIWEQLVPRRSLTTSKKIHWFSNLTLTILNPLLLRLIFPFMAINMALIARQRGWGLLNNFDLPNWLDLAIGIIALDLIVYLQHVMFHAIPIFWRLHMMHHADLDYDLTTGLRFHPIEITLSMGIKVSVVAILGPPVAAVLIFEIILNSAAVFNHGNVSLPKKMDRVLRYLIVTPDMHRVHHSVIIRKTNSNYGFNLPWWDRLFGTYCEQPAKGHTHMTIGLSQFREPKRLTLPWLLILPFIGDPGRQPINRH
ncbi:MAG: sterol desaturase family protein [Desulfobacterales bacterium]|nr:MAG: sterol desaturase family protein [Desulfobacterales bacterium]